MDLFTSIAAFDSDVQRKRINLSSALVLPSVHTYSRNPFPFSPPRELHTFRGNDPRQRRVHVPYGNVPMDVIG